MNAVRTSAVRIAGYWVRVPNWAIVERKPWSTERKNRARDNARRLGQLETFVRESRLTPWIVLGVFAAVVYVTGWAAETLAAALPKPF